MDRVTENLLSDFLEENELSPSGDVADDFESFVNYAIISREHAETFDVDQVNVGSGGDTGLDGIAVLVNGRLVTEQDEIDDLRRVNGYLDVEFVFTQAKIGTSFDSGEILKFTRGVQDFFSKHPKLERNEFVAVRADLAAHIFSQSAAMARKGLPRLKLFFVTTGDWQSPGDLVGIFDEAKEVLLKTKLFSSVEWYAYGAAEIQKAYLSTKDKIKAAVVFENKATLPLIKGVTQAYIGTLPFSEFLKLIQDDSGDIRLPVFYDNVRAYQGDTPVNAKIEETITEKRFDEFVILNNGVAIVAESMTVVGNSFTLEGYQIVNGCQTSFVLFNNRDLVKDKSQLHVPIKLVSTKDEDIVNSIIEATNSQTPVKPEQLAALARFQKSLELFYETFKGDDRLYYERRAKQFSGQSDVKKTRIVTISLQIKAFSAMFLGQPHRVSRYYGSLVQEIGTRIFAKSDKPEPYYTSALCYYRLENLFRSQNLDARYKRARYHILYGIRLFICGKLLPPMNSRKMVASSDDLRRVINNPTLFLSVVNDVRDVIDSLGLRIEDRDTFRTQSIHDKIERALLERAETYTLPGSTKARSRKRAKSARKRKSTHKSR